MTPTRMHAILRVLGRGKEPRVGALVLRIFGASAFDDCWVTYNAVGKSERATLDDAIEGIVAGASAAFQLSVDNEEA